MFCGADTIIRISAENQIDMLPVHIAIANSQENVLFEFDTG